MISQNNVFAGPLGGATDYTYNNMGRLVSESTVPGDTESFEYNELNLHNKYYDNDIRFFASYLHQVVVSRFAVIFSDHDHIAFGR